MTNEQKYDFSCPESLKRYKEDLIDFIEKTLVEETQKKGSQVSLAFSYDKKRECFLFSHE